MFLSLLLHSFLWIKKARPQQVLATWAYPDAVAASWIANILRVPFSFKIHGSDINVHGKYPSRARQIRGASYRARHIISVSSALAHEAEAIGIAPDKIRVIYNGVDHARFGAVLPTPYDRDYVLFVGNLKPEKGVIELLDGFGAVAGRYPELDLVYAGAGSMHDAIVAKADALGLSVRVRMLGATNYDEIPAWMGNCRFLALPSHNEGVPNVILEAMASGKPVLATNVGGIPEIIVSSEFGILIAAGDWEGIAKAIPEMLEKEWSERTIKARARDFTWERNIDQMLEVLHSGE